MKKRTKPRIFTRDMAQSFSEELLPIIQNLTTLGFTETEIGQVVGFGGYLTKTWLKSLQKGRQDVDEAIKTGRMLAKSCIIAKLVQASLGYDYDEVDEYWEATKGKGQGNHWKLKRKTVHKRKQPPSIPAMLQLASKLMPEFFKQKALESGPDSLAEEQINKLSGKLLDDKNSGVSGSFLGDNSQGDERKSCVSQGEAQPVGEGQRTSAVDAGMDSQKAANSI